MAADYLSPNLDPMHFVVRQSQINSVCGFSITRQDSCTLLNRMGLEATPASSPAVLKTILSSALNSSSDGIKAAQPDDVISVLVPPTRPDILHECDLIEDVAVAYGFNNIKKTFPSTNTVGKPFAPSKLGDIVRRECALAGWLEVLPLTLVSPSATLQLREAEVVLDGPQCSHDENFAFLNRKDDGTTAVVLSNPATFEYQVVRTSLLPGLLKTIRENRKRPLPMRIFEVSDVVLKDDGEERRARNVRRLGGLFTDKKAGFEVVHGLLDRVMDMLDAEFEVKGGGTSVAAAGKRRAARYKYWLEQSDGRSRRPRRPSQTCSLAASSDRPDLSAGSSGPGLAPTGRPARQVARRADGPQAERRHGDRRPRRRPALRRSPRADQRPARLAQVGPPIGPPARKGRRHRHPRHHPPLGPVPVRARLPLLLPRNRPGAIPLDSRRGST